MRFLAVFVILSLSNRSPAMIIILMPHSAADSTIAEKVEKSSARRSRTLSADRCEVSGESICRSAVCNIFISSP